MSFPLSFERSPLGHHDHNHEHSHGHGHDGNGHDDHDHGTGESNLGEPTDLLWKRINFENIITLNESETDSGALIVEKPWGQRLSVDPVLMSSTDEQLLMYIPFTGSAKLHSILIRAAADSQAPKTMNLYQNKENLDFSSAMDLQPTQTIVCSQTNEVQELPLKRAVFGNTWGLTILFADNYGDDLTQIYYLGFKGTFMELNREPVEVLYEKAANPKDHTPIVGIGDRATQGSHHGM